MMEVRQQKSVKGRNISVRDVVSHMFVWWDFYQTHISGKWMEPWNLFGLLCFPWRGFYGYMHDVWILYLINPFLQPHFCVLIYFLSKFGSQLNSCCCVSSGVRYKSLTEIVNPWSSLSLLPGCKVNRFTVLIRLSFKK